MHCALDLGNVKKYLCSYKLQFINAGNEVKIVYKKPEKDITLVRWNSKDDLSKMINISGYNIMGAYRFPNCGFMHLVRELWFKAKLPNRHWWYNHSIRNYNGIIIIFDAMVEKKFPEWIKQQNPNARVIFWYWNKVTANRISPEAIRNSGCELWSYSFVDCRNFDMKLNHSFYIESSYDFLKVYDKDEKLYDLVFIGRDKGRLKKIKELQEDSILSKLKCYIHITADHFYKKWENKEYKKIISYQQTLKLQIKGKAILELILTGSSGLTLRTMDALYLGQKLVTDNKYIRFMNFYNPHNIFIIDDDDPHNIYEFLNTPYEPVPQKIYEEYCLQEWVNRFIKNEPQSVNT